MHLQTEVFDDVKGETNIIIKALIIIIVLFLGACNTAAPVDDVESEVQVLLVNSELIQGPNRFAIALQDEAGELIHDADVQFQYFDLADADHPVPENSATAVKVQSADETVTLFTHSRRFEQAGAWGVEITATLPDGSQAVQRISLTVQEDSPALLPGEPSPFVDTPTAAEANGDLSQISTAEKPNPAFYELSLTEALANEKPTLLYFATPAFCQTKVCGPGYEEFDRLHTAVGDDYNFIHAEVYADLNNPAENDWPLIPAMTAFGLGTEPWLYVIDTEGTAVFRVEGLFTAEEMTTILNELNLVTN